MGFNGDLMGCTLWEHTQLLKIIIYSWFSHDKWWFSHELCKRLPEGIDNGWTEVHDITEYVIYRVLVMDDVLWIYHQMDYSWWFW